MFNISFCRSGYANANPTYAYLTFFNLQLKTYNFKRLFLADQFFINQEIFSQYLNLSIKIMKISYR